MRRTHGICRSRRNTSYMVPALRQSTIIAIGAITRIFIIKFISTNSRALSQEATQSSQPYLCHRGVCIGAVPDHQTRSVDVNAPVYTATQCRHLRDRDLSLFSLTYSVKVGMFGLRRHTAMLTMPRAQT